MNGMPRQSGLLPNGMPNGAPLPGSGPLPTGGQGPVSFSTGGSGPQLNGMPGPASAPPAPGATPGQPQNFQPLLPGQRPPLGPQQQRGPNGIPPFPSPTMAHSPQNTGGAPGQQHPQAPMNQLGPSPHLAHMNRGGMLPPNGPQGMNPAMGSAQQANTPNPAFQQLGRPLSRAATPQSNMMPNPSPSLMARQPPGPMHPGPDMRQIQENSVNNELQRIPQPILSALKQEAGLADKDLPSLTLEDKVS